MSYKEDIICDIDGVLCQFEAGAEKVFGRIYPDDQIAPVVDWNMSQFFRHPNEFKHIVFDSQRDGGMAEQVVLEAPAYPFVKEIFGTATEMFNVHLVTSRPEFLRQATEQWLKENGIVGYENLEFREDKHNYYPGTILIDDGVHNLIDFQKTGRWTICVNRPWNIRWPGLRAADFSNALACAIKIHWFELSCKRKAA